MAKLLKLRRGSTTQHASFTGAEGEVTIDTTKDTAVVHDGSQAGGRPLAREDMSNVSSASIAGQLGTDSIATTKIAGGALPTDVTVASANIVNGTIVNEDVNASAAIAGSKISPTFTSAISTTGNITTNGDIFVSSTYPRIHMTDTNNNSDYLFVNDNGNFRIYDDTNSAARLSIDAGGTTNIAGNLDVGAGVDVTGNIGVTGTVDGRDVAADGAKLDGGIMLADGDKGDITVSNSGATFTIDNDAVTLAKIENFDSGRIMGRLASGTGDCSQLTASSVRSIINVEDGATADQTASEIVSLLGGQNLDVARLYSTNGTVGRDSTDYIEFVNNTRLDVVINGSNEFRFESDGDFHADGDVIAQSTTISSDINLKENIKVVPNALDKVESLRGVTFDWKRDGTPSAGVIAQEVQGVLPEAVKEVTPVKGGDSHLSVNYHALTSILIEAIKDLKAEIDELKGGK
jgi:hypothetical protein